MIELNLTNLKYPNDTKKEFPYAWPIAAALEQSGEFREWMLLKSGLQGREKGAKLLDREQYDCRKSKPAFWWKDNYCGRKSACPFHACGQTDLLAVFKLSDDNCVALNIEVKHPGERPLDKDQVDSCLKRAECWRTNSTRPKRILPHEQSVTLLVCSEAFEKTHGALTQLFDRTISIEQLAGRISPYPLRAMS